MKRLYLTSCTSLLRGYKSVSILLLISIILIPSGCEKADGSGSPLQSSNSSPLVTEFYRLAQKDLTEDGVGSSTYLYVSKLPRKDQLTVARATADDPDPRLDSFGLNLLIQLGYEDEAVPKFAKMVAAGRDLTGFGWMWVHLDDNLLATRMYVKISRYLLDHSEEIRGEELEHAKSFMCQDGLGETIHGCSKMAIIERLEKIEMTMPKRPDQTKRP